LTPEELQALARLDTGSVVNAIETFGVRLRNQGFCDGTVRCYTPGIPPLVGYAVTGRIRCSVPPTVGRSFHERTDWWEHILQQPPPRVVVVQDVDARPGLGAFVGELHANILRALGCSGLVTNGAVRGVLECEEAGFHLFAGGLCVSSGFAHLLSFGEPVEVGDLTIQPGDLLHGDHYGVTSIPLEIAAEIPARAEKVAAQRRGIIDYCRTPGFSLAGLKERIKDLG
jgi:regulator of RNase E activity RraA